MIYTQFFQEQNIVYSEFIFYMSLCPILGTPQTVADQAPLSMWFSRQEYWSGLLFLSPYIYVCVYIDINIYIYEIVLCFSCSVVPDPLWPHGLQPTRLLCPWNFPSRILEWVAISFSILEILYIYIYIYIYMYILYIHIFICIYLYIYIIYICIICMFLCFKNSYFV